MSDLSSNKSFFGYGRLDLQKYFKKEDKMIKEILQKIEGEKKFYKEMTSKETQ